MSTNETTLPPAPPQQSPDEFVEAGDSGYKQSMSNLQIQMIAIGGAIGTGLFLGLGARLQASGPSLILAYLATGVIAYLLMRAIGELVVHRPTTGSFVSWAREFYGNRLAHLTGWITVILGSLLGIVEVAAVAVYIQYWWPQMPAGLGALCAWMLLIGSNLFSARVFGFIEVAASSIKIIAISLFILAGLAITFFGGPMGLQTEAAVENLWSGGFFTHGVAAVALASAGVVFSFSGVELTAVAAGEARNPREVMPKVARSVVWRILVFYVGSVLVLSMLMPTSGYSGAQSPFVTALSGFDIPWLGSAMNFVVLAAAVSSINATMYASVRGLRTLAANGEAPVFANRMTSHGVPVGALCTIGGVLLLGVAATALLGGIHIFELALSACAVCIVILWITLFACQLRLHRWQTSGRIPPLSYTMPGAPYTSWIGIIALVLVWVSMAVPGLSEGWQFPLFGTLTLLALITAGYQFTYRRSKTGGIEN